MYSEGAAMFVYYKIYLVEKALDSKVSNNFARLASILFAAA